MNTTAEHTKGEWAFTFNNEDFSIYSNGNPRTLAFVRIDEEEGLSEGEAEANARQIVRAVNSFPSLVDALQNCCNELESHWDATDESSTTFKLIAQAKEALQKAQQ